MLILDVNVLVVAHRPDAHPRGEDVRTWLTSRLTAVERVGVDTHVLSAVTRVVTNHRIFEDPSSPKAALLFCNVVLDAPSVVAVSPSPRHWSLFEEYVHDLRLTGNDIPDAYLAALAVDHEATLVTLDRGFRRFPGLRHLNPLTA
ncbi:MAG: TA system VapC family ribonuclease toxin [Lapillicoccus sp.]